MSKFLIYTHESGEVVFVKRDAVTSYHPKFIEKHKYKINVTVGQETYVVKQCECLEDCLKWIHDEIKAIEKLDDRKE